MKHVRVRTMDRSNQYIKLRSSLVQTPNVWDTTYRPNIMGHIAYLSSISV